MSQDSARPLTDHLSELRRRLFWILGIWLGLSIFAYVFKERAFEILAGPAVDAVRGAGRTLSVIAPAELLMSYIKASLLAGFLVSLPVTLYHVWSFVAPGLYAKEKRLVLPFVLSTTGLFFAGNLFGYYFAFPLVFDFFLSLESDYVTTQWTTETVLGFMTGLYLGFGVAFQLPVVMLFLTLARIVSVEQLSRARRYAILGMFIVGAVLTPSPDVVSQLSLTIPLIALYEVGLLASRIILRRSEASTSAQAAADPSLGEKHAP